MTITLREWLSQGPFTLTLSSGFFGFYAHTGALRALLDAGFTPRRATGSSAGALVTGLYCAGVSPDEMRDELLALRRPHFWDPGPGAGLLRGERFRTRLDALTKGARADESLVPYAASVFDVRGLTTRVRSTGPIAEIMHASCAFPGLFHPVRIEGGLYSDGGIADRPGLATLAHGERTLFHHLASRSPWRRQGAVSMRVPVRENLVAVVLEGLPRVNPFALERGVEAMARAERAMRAALDRPVRDAVVSLGA